MLISKQISEYIIFDSESVFKALEKINANQKRIIFVLSDNGILLGCLTDGDFRRWITSTHNFDITADVSEIMNVSVKSAQIDSDGVELEEQFSESIDVIPLLDSSGKLLAVALKKGDGFSIGDRTISDSSDAFIIAEIGNNHNGSVELAKELVDLAYDSGADCVKFQMRDVASLYQSGGKQDASSDLGSQYVMDLLARFQLSNESLLDVFDYCKTKGLTPLCTPWDAKSLEVLEQYGMEFYKVASADLTNHPFLELLINTGKPLICSTGMSTELEIKQTIQFLRKNGATFVLLHCNSTYPTPYKDVRLAYLKQLKKLSGGFVGYSGHERGISVPIAAVALGAKIIEKHFTVDRSMEGSDHKVSLLPGEFRQMVTDIRAVEQSIGQGQGRDLTQGEMLNRESLAKSIVASQSIKKGTIITRKMLDIKSPGQGLQPNYINDLMGKLTKRSMVGGDCFFDSDLADEIIEPRDYSFNRPFGIPVRYHDYKNLVSATNFDFVEFHLSYQDLELNLDDFLSLEKKIGFAVHSPELFFGDHLLDLTTKNDEDLEHSISELNRVCDITRALKKYFIKTKRPVIVLNAGGFSKNGFLSSQEVSQKYETLIDSLSKINQDGVEIIIQTMPPFPWHFGGQSYHNLFVDPKEIAEFCKKTNYRICYDVSHSMMACNYYNWKLSEFTRTVGPHIAHMHIVDALGSDGEGIQIGKGDVCFTELSAILSDVAPNVMFLPEVWQGHKNKGEGFWVALDFLERYNL